MRSSHVISSMIARMITLSEDTIADFCQKTNPSFYQTTSRVALMTQAHSPSAQQHKHIPAKQAMHPASDPPPPF